jgi:hypothetical protein
MTAPAREPRGSGPHVPSGARVHNYWTGGSSHYEADRRKAAEIEAALPQARQMALDAVLFHARAVGYAAGQGIGQFIDLGCGLPPRSSAPHRVARSMLPGAATAYVDGDPDVCDEIWDLLGDGERDGVAVVCADLRDPAAVLADARLRGVVDLAGPVCMLASSVPHFLPPARARRTLAAYVRAAAPGSLFAVCVPHVGDQQAWEQVAAAYSLAVIRNYTVTGLSGLLGGLEIVSPGVAAAGRLSPGWADAPRPRPGASCVLAAIGRKA